MGKVKGDEKVPVSTDILQREPNRHQPTEAAVHKKILTETKERFAQAFVANGGDGPAAYDLVVPNPDRLPASSGQYASVLRHDPEVEERIQELRERASRPFMITAQMVVQRALDIAMSDSRDRIPALNIVAKFFPEFKEGTTVDARSLNLTLPPGTTLQDIQALRDSLSTRQEALPGPIPTPQTIQESDNPEASSLS